MPTDKPLDQDVRDTGGIVVAVIMILLAVLAIWDTTDMTDSDSFIFPRAVAIAMITFSLLFIARQVISPSLGVNDEAGVSGGSTPRRLGLVVTMISSALLMPWVGFLISGVLAFGSIMMLAMYDEWTVKRRVVFSLSGIAIVVGFYFMFAELLLVPLPVGSIFE
jgi:hypothetical protein